MEAEEEVWWCFQQLSLVEAAKADQERVLASSVQASALEKLQKEMVVSATNRALLDLGSDFNESLLCQDQGDTRAGMPSCRGTPKLAKKVLKTRRG